MDEGELALPPRQLLAQHQDAGLRRGAPLKEEERGARAIGGLRDLRSP